MEVEACQLTMMVESMDDLSSVVKADKTMLGNANSVVVNKELKDIINAVVVVADDPWGEMIYI